MSIIRRNSNQHSPDDEQPAVKNDQMNPERAIAILDEAMKIIDKTNKPTEERLDRLKTENPYNVPGLPQLNDLGNGIRLRDRFGDELFHCSSFKRWYRWDGSLWKPDNSEREVRKCAQKVVSEIYYDGGDTALDDVQRKRLAKHAIDSGKTHRITAMIKESSVMDGVAINAEELDADPYLLNCLNGTIDLRTGELREHKKDDLITKFCPVCYKPHARCKRWEDFLLEAAENNEEIILFLQRAVGCTLIGSNRDEVLFFIYGPTASGKSTFSEAFANTLGTYTVRADFTSFLKRRNIGGPRPDIARLAGSRMVLSIETEKGHRFAEGFLKMYTGRDKMVARFLYGKEFEFTVRGQLWLVSNDPPRIDAGDSAIWRRIVFIPFANSIPAENRDPTLKEELLDSEEARAAILAWAVKGCLEWQKKGLQIPDIVRNSTKEQRQTMSPLADFIDTCCEVDLDNQYYLTRGNLLWEAYESFAQENHLRYPLTKGKFWNNLKILELNNIQKRDGDKVKRFWQGIRLKNNDDLGL